MAYLDSLFHQIVELGIAFVNLRNSKLSGNPVHFYPGGIAFQSIDESANKNCSSMRFGREFFQESSDLILDYRLYFYKNDLLTVVIIVHWNRSPSRSILYLTLSVRDSRTAADAC